MTKTDKKNVIIVPVDFSEASEIAIHSAVELAKVFNFEIVLLNIFENVPVDEVAKKQMQSQFVYRDILSRLQNEADNIIKNEKIKAQFLIKEGNIFDHIGKTAEEVGANLMVMGTHGIKGVQHITGSYAAKVICHTFVPVIIVQRKTNYKAISNMVVPFDLTSDTKALEEWAIYYAKKFNATLHIVIDDKNNNYTLMKEELTLPQIRKSIKENHINHSFKTIPSGDGDFIKHFLNYSSEAGADLIMIEQKKDVDEFVIGKDEQSIITNPHQVPVFCLNPENSPIPE